MSVDPRFFAGALTGFLPENFHCAGCSHHIVSELWYDENDDSVFCLECRSEDAQLQEETSFMFKVWNSAQIQCPRCEWTGRPTEVDGHLESCDFAVPDEAFYMPPLSLSHEVACLREETAMKDSTIDHLMDNIVQREKQVKELRRQLDELLARTESSPLKAFKEVDIEEEVCA